MHYLARIALVASLGFAVGLELPRRGALDRVFNTFGASLGLGVALSAPRPAVAASDSPVVVLGASGKTGRAVVAYAASQGLPVRATTRSGKLPEGLRIEASARVEGAPADVKDLEQLRKAVQGAAGVVYAASASRQKDFAKADDAKAVDYGGVVRAAEACIEAGVPRLVLVSSGGVSKPDSAVYKFLNIFGGIMKYKFDGEEALRALYRDPKARGLSYTIVRPGGLTEEPALGPVGLALNQGDTLSGRISREDVAAICVESLGRKTAAGATLECYDKEAAQPLGSVGLNNIFKGGAAKEDVTLTQLTGSSWEALFAGLRADA